ncbi:unnamed protein product, partial [Choristocarpus tenellus]
MKRPTSVNGEVFREVECLGMELKQGQEDWIEQECLAVANAIARLLEGSQGGRKDEEIPGRLRQGSLQQDGVRRRLSISSTEGGEGLARSGDLHLKQPAGVPTIVRTGLEENDL